MDSNVVFLKNGAPLTMKVKYLPSYNVESWGDLGYAKPGDAGFDLRAAFGDQSIVLEPGERRLVPAGFSVALPAGYEMQIRSRSGLSLKQGLIVLNAPGTIDAGYRGEIGVVLYNASNVAQTVSRGDRVAQAVLAEVTYMPFEKVEELPSSERGEGGFGSTGVAA